jgi:cation-transporting ATPase 13A1
MAPLVDNAQIAGASLHNPLPFFLHAYIWPFMIVWPIFLRYYLTAELYETHIQSSEWTFVWCGTIITAQSLVWLSTHWNVNLRSLFTTTTAKTIDEARLIKVHPVANAGPSEICKIVRDNVGSRVYESKPLLMTCRLAAN